MLLICLTALSLTLDSFGVGFTYGLKHIKIGVSSICIMCIISFIIALLSAAAGAFLNDFLPDALGKYISVSMLLILCIYMLISSRQSASQNPPEVCGNKFGFYIAIIKHPQYGDFDSSDSIDIKEAMYTGIALSIDALGAGIGLGLSGPGGVFYALLVGIFQFVFIALGIWSGKKLNHLCKVSDSALAVLPGIILIILALCRFVSIK